MQSRAVVIGIDKYAAQPLTSAVRDAQAFRDRIVSLGLVDVGDVTLLIDQAATRKGIGDALKAIYDNGAHLDRLYFYFSGHGMMAPVDAAGAVLCTALIPIDVLDLGSDSHLLINVDDLRDRFRLAGPKEQIFVVDACRDLAFGTSPGNVPDISWQASPNPSSPANGQAVLYAVSPRARALAAVEGMGIMTSHLLDALADDGMGVEWSDELGTYAITMQSLRNCVRAKVKAAVEHRPYWEQQYMLPELETTDPPIGALRLVHDPPSRPLVVTIEPLAAAGATDVTLAQRRNELAKPKWPPIKSGQEVTVQPQRYEIVAHSRVGAAVADPPWIDVRVQSTAVVRVLSPDEEIHAAVTDRAGPSTAAVFDHGVDRIRALAKDPTGHVVARALEPEATVEVEGLEPPYRRWSAAGALDQDVMPGFYRIRFRIGPEVFSETEFEVVPGQDVTIEPAVAHSAVLEEMIGDTARRSDVVLSESIGPMQSAVIDTMLPIIGLKSFDTTGELFGQFTGLVPSIDPSDLADRPVSVVVAAEGTDWPWRVTDMLSATACELRPHGSPAEPGRTNVSLEPLSEERASRIAVGFAAAPGTSFDVVLSAPHFGRIELSAASILGRVTVVTIKLSPDGSLDLSQNLLRVPGREYDEPVPDIPYGRMLRELQLGQKLFKGGELVTHGLESTQLMELLYAKWTDPILGCMAYYAWIDTHSGESAEAVAYNLWSYFNRLPDSAVIAGRQWPDQAPELYATLLDEGKIPVLARSTRELARYARQTGNDNAPVVQRADALLPRSAWTTTWDLTQAAVLDRPVPAVLAGTTGGYAKEAAQS